MPSRSSKILRALFALFVLFMDLSCVHDYTKKALVAGSCKVLKCRNVRMTTARAESGRHQETQSHPDAGLTKEQLAAVFRLPEAKVESPDESATHHDRDAPSISDSGGFSASRRAALRMLSPEEQKSMNEAWEQEQIVKDMIEIDGSFEKQGLEYGWVFFAQLFLVLWVLWQHSAP